jgi:tRNA A-37 threonylcarbamoyl transferase component Bud32
VKGSGMAFVEINPRHRDLLQRCQLCSASGFLALPGLVISGHPERHVVRVTLGHGPGAVAAFLKREHRLPWKDRVINAGAGFGFASKSCREARILQALEPLGIGCPEWLAVGEDDRGRAFLLVREVAGTDLRVFLHARWARAEEERHRFAQHLGRALAHVHNAGFDHPDLCAKHVLVDPDDETISFLDWQRSRRRSRVSWARRCQDLAALCATLADDLASQTERLACLRSYLRECRRQHIPTPDSVLRVAFHILYQEKRLLRQRRIREQRSVPRLSESPSVIWLDGEKLCLTPEMHSLIDSRIPAMFVLANLPPRPRNLQWREVVLLTATRSAVLVRRRTNRLVRGCWAWLCRRPLTSPETRRAGILFRLQRFGIPAPRVLAFGQQRVVPWRTESFLLTESPARLLDLSAWLAEPFAAGGPSIRERGRALREAAELLRRLHEADCYLEARADDSSGPFFLELGRERQGSVVLGNPEAVRLRRPRDAKPALGDLVGLHNRGLGSVRRTDALRFLLSYLRQSRLTFAAKRFARELLAARQPSRAQRRAVA